MEGDRLSARIQHAIRGRPPVPACVGNDLSRLPVDPEDILELFGPENIRLAELALQTLGHLVKSRRKACRKHAACSSIGNCPSPMLAFLSSMGGLVSRCIGARCAGRGNDMFSAP